jgi:pimeloyl-ACP methyl ester carboxylesterase/quercetin dioxygenase-like cupin family protein
VTEQRVAIDSLEIHVESVGEGVPVVLIHGLGLSGAIWNRVRDSLGPGYRLVMIDLRGAGGTHELVQKELSLEQWATDLGALLAALEIERPVLVGHSLGASIALKYALEQPGDVGALVLIGVDANLSNLAPRMLTSAERIEAIGMEAWVAEFWSANPPFSDVSLQRDPEILEEYRSLLLRNDAADYVRQCRAIAAAESLGDRLGRLTQPALVLVGGSDDRTPPEHGRRLASSLGNARVVELADVGHTAPLEAPAETSVAIRAFLEEFVGRESGRARVLRADTTPRNSKEGPFGHLDVRCIVGPESGATLISFGQSTYPQHVTHENHYHPNAEEVVMVMSGRGTQHVGEDALDLGPGDTCFIPRNTPHRIKGTSEEDLVILWAFGGAASIEQAGYVPLPD